MSANYVAGEFKIESFTLINQYQESLDIQGLVSNFKIYESIFSKFLTGEVSLVDALNLPKNFRMTGQEYLRISIRQKEGIDEEAEKEFSIDKTFRIYAIENVTRVDELTQAYVLKICDPRMFYARRKRLSQTLRGRYDQILQNALVDVGKFKVNEFDAWEKTVPDNKQFICPNWTIEKLMDYLISNSQAGESHAFKNDFYFYQTMNGGFRFQSVDKMMGTEFPIAFTMSPRNTTLDTDKEDINAESGLNTALILYKKPQMFNTLQGTSNGAYASTLRVYDPIRKLEEINTYSLEDSLKKGQHVSGHPMIMVDEMERVLTAGEIIDRTTSPTVDEIDVDINPIEEFGALIARGYTATHSFDNAETLDEQEVFEPKKLNDSGSLQRIALREIMRQNRITAQIPLRTDLSVGMVIKFGIPTPEAMGEGTKYDKANDDRYLITDLSLSASPSSKQGILTLECVKESFAEKIETLTPIEEAPPAVEEPKGTFHNSRG